MQGKKGEPGEKADTVDKTKEAYQVRWMHFGLIHIPLSNQWFACDIIKSLSLKLYTSYNTDTFSRVSGIKLHAKFWVNTKLLSRVADVLIS